MRNVSAIFRKQLKDTLKNKTVLIQFIMFPVLTLIMNNAIRIDGMPENFFCKSIRHHVHRYGSINQYGCYHSGRKEKKHSPGINDVKCEAAGVSVGNRQLCLICMYAWRSYHLYLRQLQAAEQHCFYGRYGNRTSGFIIGRSCNRNMEQNTNDGDFPDSPRYDAFFIYAYAVNV